MSSKLTYSVLDPITPDEGIEALQTLAGGPLGPGRCRTAASGPGGRGNSRIPRARLLRANRGGVRRFG